MPSIFKIKYVFLALIFVACNKDEENTAEKTFGIRHDKTLDAYEAVATNTAPYDSDLYPDFSPVLAFTYTLNGSKDFEYVASGVLISESWILTAGHNFFVSEEQSSPAQVGGIEVQVGNDPNNPDKSVEVTELVFHPTWLTHDDVYGNANDFCLVKLAEPCTNITPATLYHATDETTGATSWYCGYGDYSEQAGQDANLYSLKHAIQNILDRVKGGISTTATNGTVYTGGLLVFDFDSPDGDVNALGDDYDSQDEALFGTGTSSASATEFEGGTVEGDSGGPLFIQKDGQWLVAGILSGGAPEPVPDHESGNYGDISVFTRVSLNYDWIESVVGTGLVN